MWPWKGKNNDKKQFLKSQYLAYYLIEAALTKPNNPQVSVPD